MKAEINRSKSPAQTMDGVSKMGKRCLLGEEGCNSTANAPCDPQDRYHGRWINNLHCGTYELYNGFLVFRPQKGLVLYHGSETFTTGDPYDEPVWYGAYENSLLYAKSVDMGYMNNFRISKSPRLFVLTDSKNIQQLLDLVDEKTATSISRVTGVGRKSLQAGKYSFGCVYENKSRNEFSRWSNRRDDTIMARAICSIDGIDGYAQPKVKYCSAGVPYRFGNPMPATNTFYGEIVICNSGRFLERVTSEAIPCFDRENCDLDLDQTIEVESEYLKSQKDPAIPTIDLSKIKKSSLTTLDVDMISSNTFSFENLVTLPLQDEKLQKDILQEVVSLSSRTPTIILFDQVPGETIMFYTLGKDQWNVVSLLNVEDAESVVSILESQLGVPYMSSDQTLLHLLNTFEDWDGELITITRELDVESDKKFIQVSPILRISNDT